MMKEISRRSRKLSEQIRNDLSWIIEKKLKDPNKGFITLTYVKLSPDMKLASVYYTILGEIESRNKTQEVLNRSVSFLRYELRDKLKIRYLPELRFFYDNTFDYSQKITNLMSKIHDEDNQ
ncbi:MAG: 30S ribosome-binding factor RbfA [Calditrichia bacterium]|nr:30S ribosome-binding factor RbfA [Calditrichia bacterium]